MNLFTKCLLRFPRADLKDTAQNIREASTETIWGIFAGLFGVASNELVVVTVGDEARSNRWPEEVDEVTREVLVPTVRPTDATPLTREGLYVFRAFHLDGANVERVVELSDLAWQTFEGAEDYAAIPTGLFAPQNRDRECTMYLLTWYDGLESWQTSRAPHPEARANFQERHRLMNSTSAIATRLLV